MHPKTESLISVAAVCVGIVGVVSLALLIYFDDRQLVWYQGNPLDIGHFVEVEERPARGSAPASGSGQR